MDLKDVIYHKNIFCTNKKEWNTGTCYNIDESQKYYSKWNKPVIREHVFDDSIYSKGPGKIDVQKQSKLVVIWD